MLKSLISESNVCCGIDWNVEIGSIAVLVAYLEHQHFVSRNVASVA